MATDEEKHKIAKLLQELEIPEIKLTERCNGLVNEFREKFGQDPQKEEMENVVYENPYIVDKDAMEENERKLRELLAENKRAKKEYKETGVAPADPKRPWRTNSTKERLLRIENDLKRHFEKASDAIQPMEKEVMKGLVKECQEENLVCPPVGIHRLRETVDEARRLLPNFQYKIENTTATDILPGAHISEMNNKKETDLNLQ